MNASSLVAVPTVLTALGHCHLDAYSDFDCFSKFLLLFPGAYALLISVGEPG